ncbi:MAG: transposase [Thermoanaerobacteraceae bacterium]|nr:transposase [Thermoanaerobacteraceae bacterium]
MTAYYFESFIADQIKNFGYSKSNKVNQLQVVMGLLTDGNGIPISYELFPGTSDKTLSPERVIEIYNGLWKIEESFRILKSNFEAKPIFVWTKSNIEGHFVLCYLALVIQRYLEYILQQKNLKISTERIQEALKSAPHHNYKAG